MILKLLDDRYWEPEKQRIFSLFGFAFEAIELSNKGYNVIINDPNKLIIKKLQHYLKQTLDVEPKESHYPDTNKLKYTVFENKKEETQIFLINKNINYLKSLFIDNSKVHTVLILGSSICQIKKKDDLNNILETAHNILVDKGLLIFDLLNFEKIKYHSTNNDNYFKYEENEKIVFAYQPIEKENDRKLKFQYKEKVNGEIKDSGSNRSIFKLYFDDIDKIIKQYSDLYSANIYCDNEKEIKSKDEYSDKEKDFSYYIFVLKKK